MKGRVGKKRSLSLTWHCMFWFALSTTYDFGLSVCLFPVSPWAPILSSSLHYRSWGKSFKFCFLKIVNMLWKSLTALSHNFSPSLSCRKHLHYRVARRIWGLSNDFKLFHANVELIWFQMTQELLWGRTRERERKKENGKINWNTHAPRLFACIEWENWNTSTVFVPKIMVKQIVNCLWNSTDTTMWKLFFCLLASPSSFEHQRKRQNISPKVWRRDTKEEWKWWREFTRWD